MADISTTSKQKMLSAEFSSFVRSETGKRKQLLNHAVRTAIGESVKDYRSTLYERLHHCLQNDQNTPSSCIRELMMPFLEDHFSLDEREAFLSYLDNIRDLTYSIAYDRRSYRSSYFLAYVSRIVDTVSSLCEDPFQKYPLDQLIKRELPEDIRAYLNEYSWSTCGYTYQRVAIALNSGDKRVENAIRDVITDQNHSTLLTHELIRGIVCSHRKEFHEMLAKLLLAARLQEGLRQAICENADYGTFDAFKILFDTIVENNLIRFSSVKRAVGTWLGLISDEVRDLDRISEKTVQCMHHCLHDSEAIRKALSEDDSVKIHVALWRLALDSCESAIEEIRKMILEGNRNRILTAGYFISTIGDNRISHDIAKSVLLKSDLDDVILAVWLPLFLADGVHTVYNFKSKKRSFDISSWFINRDEIEPFYAILMTRYHNASKEKIFSPCVFPWYEARLSKTILAEKIVILAILLQDQNRIDEACELVKVCGTLHRSWYLYSLLAAPVTPTQRKTVFEALGDKETDTRRIASEIVNKLLPTQDEILIMESLLRLKASDTRDCIITVLMRQDHPMLSATVGRLLSAPKEEIRLGGLEIISRLHKNGSALVDELIPKLDTYYSKREPTSKESLLLESIRPFKTMSEKQLFTKEDRYSPQTFDDAYSKRCLDTMQRYFPDSLLPACMQKKLKNSSFFSRIKTAAKSLTFSDVCKQAEEDIQSLSAFIEAHKHKSIRTEYGTEHLLGELHSVGGSSDNHFFSELWEEWCDIRAMSGERIVRAYVRANASKATNSEMRSAKEVISLLYGKGFENKISVPYQDLVCDVLTVLVSKIPMEDRWLLASSIAFWWVLLAKEEESVIKDEDAAWSRFSIGDTCILNHPQIRCLYQYLICYQDDSLRDVFPLLVACCDRIESLGETVKKTFLNSLYRDESNSVWVSAVDYIFANQQGLITKEALYEFLLRDRNLPSKFGFLSTVAAWHRERGEAVYSNHSINYSNYRMRRILSAFLKRRSPSQEINQVTISLIEECYETIMPLVVDAECRRGDSVSVYTAGVGQITRLYGAETFAKILDALGRDTFDRTQYYGYSFSPAMNRSSALSHLLSVTVPRDGETAKTLSCALKGKKITKKRLIEAALYSPEWIPLVGAYLEIPSFESVAYYFMAHMNERFDDKKKAMIARYTPLTEDELNLGAFDLSWFQSAKSSIGDEEFDLIYDAAKYISDGAKHTRARKYADAASGKYSVEETEAAISDKRNKDLLMAYTLIPIKDEDDLCRRYLFLQKFLKESKKFGSQRAASEGKAVEMAMKNLASSAGYRDAMRLTLRMEAKVIDSKIALLQEQTVEGVSLLLAIGDDGKAEIQVMKDGKALKSIPSKLKKHEIVLALNEMKKTLTEQYRRARLMFEQAMEDGTIFEFCEIESLSHHPVVSPILKKLVLQTDSFDGFWQDGVLVAPNGNTYRPETYESLVIAHPYTLYRRGIWREYQEYLYNAEIRQPFRQVFRELYIKTDDEKGKYHSLRYAGNQIMPPKTVSVLKQRRWVADIENGLQKVYYKENIIARIYALADWFSPADIEAPTLEWVVFTDRQSDKSLMIDEIPDVIFSEVMRDVDLAVSVAHAGGVDPEASHSTVEMRAAILSFVLPMFKVKNVTVQDQHALIKGTMADYSVHLGSGTVHQLGGSMLPVLPVHSQHRGRIFLPFVDDDPKTSEIISKILLFAFDQTIKDPTILSLIVRQ